ncbi:F-box protein [Criblamydia sequanensis]|uniref:F-box domain-containing protein n=1 Tax=Candidatus Criblamydia sequanensis CRIB-18 TaxID=1437425 RepID=A0A090D2G7_9BACT|nr:F-box protein [Criblamydia sequanensis]CDR34635.1 F-box domain-containing protein [Criblamydia sequanensis CRIB-18]
MNIERSFPLPNELTFQIFTFLDVKNLIAASKVCKEWKEIANDDCLWKLFLDKTKSLPPFRPNDPYFLKNFVIKSELGLFKLNLNPRFLNRCNENLINSLSQIKQAKNLCNVGLPLATVSHENCVVELEFLRMDEERNLAIFLGDHKFIFKNTENKIVQEIPFPVIAPAEFCILKNWAVFVGKKGHDKEKTGCYALNFKTGRVTRLIRSKKNKGTDSKKTSGNNPIRPKTFEETGPYLSCKLGDTSLAVWKINPKSKCKTPITILDGINGETNYLNVSYDKIIRQANNQIQIFSLATKKLLYSKPLPDLDYLLDCKDQNLIFSNGQEIYHIDLSLEKIEEASFNSSVETPITNHKISALCFAKNGYLWGTNWGAIYFNDLKSFEKPDCISFTWCDDHIKFLSSSEDFAAAIRNNTLLFINLRNFKTFSFEFLKGEKVETIQCLNSRLFIKTNYAHFCYDLDVKYVPETMTEKALSTGKQILSGFNLNLFKVF